MRTLAHVFAPYASRYPSLPCCLLFSHFPILFFSRLPPPPSSTLFPYTTLFRSVAVIELNSTEIGDQWNRWRIIAQYERFFISIAFQKCTRRAQRHHPAFFLGRCG